MLTSSDHRLKLFPETTESEPTTQELLIEQEESTAVAGGIGEAEFP